MGTNHDSMYGAVFDANGGTLRVPQRPLLHASSTRFGESRAVQDKTAIAAQGGSAQAEADTMVSKGFDFHIPSMSLDLDFAGRVQKIRAPAAHSLHALFEAVANSFDSTEHLGDRARIYVASPLCQADDNAKEPYSLLCAASRSDD